MNKERWRPIRGYENYYKISNLGNVKSLERKRKNGKGYYIKEEKLMKLSMSSTGYHKITLSVDNKKKILKFID